MSCLSFCHSIEWQNIFFRCKGTVKNANHQKFSGKDMNHIEKKCRIFGSFIDSSYLCRKQIRNLSSQIGTVDGR